MKNISERRGKGIICVAAAVLLHEGKVLIARRRPGMRHAGEWEFPGGRIEAGETPEAALTREIEEELGIAVRTAGFFAESRYRYDHAEVRILAYKVEWISGEIRLLDHDRYAWVFPGLLFDYNLLPADLPLAEKLARSGRREGFDSKTT
jgi:8-oxo-dGTP diphosphatase